MFFTKSCTFASDMSNKDSTIVNLRDARLSDVSRHTRLDNEYFESLGQEEILGGSLEVDWVVRYGAADTFTFNYIFQGHVSVPCDRCLEAVDIPLSFTESLQVAYDTEDNDNGDLTIIPFSQLTYDTAMDMFELIMLNLPLQRVHPLGGCDVDMLSRFSIELDSEDGE